MSITHQLHAASQPFVTRALRGGHRGRYAAIAMLLALVSVVLGAWVALGSGSFEQQLRVDLRLEPTMETQENQGFKLFAEDEYEAVELHRLIRAHRSALGLARIARDELQIHEALEGRVVNRLRDGLIELTSVQRGGSDRLSDYREPTNALLARFQLDDIELYRDWSRGDGLETRERLDNILARELRPAVEIYRSPLAVADALKLTGMIAGGLTLLLLMVYAPVLAGTQMAQEVHENTLQPLTGTALSARELVLGLSLGPAAVVALLAAPQVILFLAAAIAVGHVLPALALLLVGLIGGAFLTMLAQLAGFALGGTRTPGILGVVLLALLAPLALFGAAFGLDLPRSGIGVLALIPQAAAGHTLFETFLPAGTALRAPELSALDITGTQFSVAFGTLGMLCFAYLGLRALERRVGELAPAALRRGEALLGALVSIALVLLANPWRHGSASQGFYLGNLLLVLVPLTILLMMRVPLGDTPSALRRVPFAGLLAEFAVGVGLYFAIVIGLTGTGRFELLGSPVALVYLAWMVAVIGLLAIRIVALPMTLLAKVWAGVCMVGVGVAFVHVNEWSRGSQWRSSSVVGLWDASPVLGILQVVLMVLIPVLLVRALQNRGRRAAAPE